MAGTGSAHFPFQDKNMTCFSQVALLLTIIDILPTGKTSE